MSGGGWLPALSLKSVSKMRLPLSLLQQCFAAGAPGGHLSLKCIKVMLEISSLVGRRWKRCFLPALALVWEAAQPLQHSPRLPWESDLACESAVEFFILQPFQKGFVIVQHNGSCFWVCWQGLYIPDLGGVGSAVSVSSTGPALCGTHSRLSWGQS